jgi:hypothetical protein
MQCGETKMRLIIAMTCLLLATACTEEPQEPKIIGWNGLALGMSLAQAKQVIVAGGGRIDNRPSTKPASSDNRFSVVEFGGRQDLHPLVLLLFEQDRLKALTVEYYGADWDRPRSGQACDALFEQAKSDLAPLFDWRSPSRTQEKGGDHAQLIRRMPNAVAHLDEWQAIDSCASVTALLFAGDEAALAAFKEGALDAKAEK